MLTYAGVFNVAFIAIFLRLSLPRLLAMQSMGDLGDFSKELGLPGREELGVCVCACVFCVCVCVCVCVLLCVVRE